MDVSILLVNYNTAQITKACLDSIFEMTRDVNFEVILVDNNSLDGSKELFEQDKRITYIYSTKNLGFGRANNLAFAHSTGKYVFCLNSDTLLLNNAVKLFYDAMEHADDQVACMGSKLMDVNRQYMHSYGHFPTMLKNLKWHLGFPNSWRDTSAPEIPDGKSMDVDYITGADLFVRRKVIEKLGFYDPDFFLYYEETEMQWRYKHHGYANLLIATPQIIHLEGGSAKKRTGLKYFRTLVKRTDSARLYFKKTNAAWKYYPCVLPFIALDFLLVVYRWLYSSLKNRIC